MAWHILRQGHLRLLSLMWCQAIYNLWLSCCIGPGIWRLWMFGGLVGADGLAYLDARPSAAPEFDVVPSHLQPLVVMLYWARYLEVVNVWRPGRCRWLGISWCKAICSFWVWCGAKPFTTFGCGAVVGQVFWRLWMFGSLVGADGLAYLDARPSAAPEFDVVLSHLQPLVVVLYWDGYFGRLWVFGSLVGADGLAYLDARPSAAPEFDVVPSHLQPLTDQDAC